MPTGPQPKPLSTKQLSAIQSLLACTTTVEAARQAGVAEQTLHRWRKEPAFVAVLQREQALAMGRVVDQLRRHAGDAVGHLVAIMRDIDNPPSVRVSAADKLLTHAIRYVDAVEIRAEVEAVKAEIEAMKHQEPAGEEPK